MSILVIVEHDNAVVKPATLAIVTAGRELAEKAGGDVAALVVGASCGAVGEAVAKIAGVDKVLVADAPYLETFLAEPVADTIVKVAADYDYVVAPASTFGKNVLPRVAAQLDSQQISDVTAIHAADEFVHPVYAGNAMETVKSADAKKVMTVRDTVFDKAAEEGGSATVETIEAAPDAGLSSFVSQELTKSERPELTVAPVIVSGGRGVKDKDGFVLVEKLADKLGAAVGATRSAVDEGLVSNDLQIGQTGKIVAPKLYIALGISGAIQHLAGMKDSKVIVAVNKDEEAPIFQVADYGIVGDLFKIAPELEEKL